MIQQPNTILVVNGLWKLLISAQWSNFLVRTVCYTVPNNSRKSLNGCECKLCQWAIHSLKSHKRPANQDCSIIVNQNQSSHAMYFLCVKGYPNFSQQDWKITVNQIDIQGYLMYQQSMGLYPLYVLQNFGKNWLACGLYNLWKSPKMVVSRTTTIIMQTAVVINVHMYCYA